MFKLIVVAGPNRGTSFAVQSETSIGRQNGNAIVLDSSKVSKRHCTLVVDNTDISVKDEGSSNGTFVNGVLTRLRKLKPGDRISVGEYVLELTQSVDRPIRMAPALPGFGNVVQFPGSAGGGFPIPAGNASDSLRSHNPGVTLGEPGSGVPVQAPTDLKGKALWFFEHQVMPFFYDLSFKNEWRVIGLGIFAAFILVNLLFSVSPLMDASRSAVVREVGKRAAFMAKQIAEHNAAALAAKAETRTEIGSAEREDGVRVALLTDLDSRIIAPASKSGQSFALGVEARLAVKARELFKRGRETGVISEADSETIVAVEPVKVFNPALAKNQTVAMVIVSLDTSLSTPSLGDIGLVYSETLIFTVAIGLVLLFIMYRITLKPFQVLNDDIDKVLKGDMGQVTHEFKIEELNPLWDVINSALQRASMSDGSAHSSQGFTGPAYEEVISGVRLFGEIEKFGVVFCDADRKIVYVNSLFEEISGLRSENVIGQDIPSVARDQAFGSLSSDLFDRSLPGSDGPVEDFEFSGISHNLRAAAFGALGYPPKSYVLVVVKNEG